MVDDVKDILETTENKGGHGEPAERSKLARERREVEQRRRLDELRAHAAAAQEQREKRDAERRRRADEQRSRDNERRVQVEERKKAIWEASVSRRESLLRREREREERMERSRTTRPPSRVQAFAFGSSTPRMLEPADTGGYLWAHRSTNPLDQMNFFESLASSTSNVMFASAPLTRRASALHLDTTDCENKDDADKPLAAMWSSVARRRTDLVPTVPAPRAPELRSGESTPGSRPGSAMSTSVCVPRRVPAPRRPRPASIAGTGMNTPRGVEAISVDTTPSVSRDASSTNMGTPGVVGPGGDAVVRRAPAPRRPRPQSLHVTSTPATPRTPMGPGEGKPPLHRKPKLSKESEKSTPRGGVRMSVSPGRRSPSPRAVAPPAPTTITQKTTSLSKDMNQVNATEVTQKLEALQLQKDDNETQRPTENQKPESQDPVKAQESENADDLKKPVKPAEIEKSSDAEKPVKAMENSADPEKALKNGEAEKSVLVEKLVDAIPQQNNVNDVQKDVPVVQKPAEKQKPVAQKPVEITKAEKKEAASEKTEEVDMSASMTARRITTEEEAKAALAERRRRAREELERQAELDRQRLALEAEQEEERQRQEEERQRQLEEEARELAALQRQAEEEKLRKAIEAQQQLEREAVERAAREEVERAVRARDEEEERKAREVAERARRAEAEREERERVARRQRVEAIMLRTRQRKAEEEQKQQGTKNDTSIANESANADSSFLNDSVSSVTDGESNNGNVEASPKQNNFDLLGLSNIENANPSKPISLATTNFLENERKVETNTLQVADLLGSLSLEDNANSRLDNAVVQSDIINTTSQHDKSSAILQPSNVDLLSSSVEVIAKHDMLVNDGAAMEGAAEPHETSNGYSGLNGHNPAAAPLNGSTYPLTLHNAV